MSLILMTTLFYKAVILQGENWCSSLLGLKLLQGLKLYSRFSNNSNENFDQPAATFILWGVLGEKHKLSLDLQ